MTTSALTKARETARLNREAGVEVVRMDPTEKARANPTSLRCAINAKCWDCQGAMSDPGVRERIGSCLISSCSLHPVRPYQRGEAE